MNVVYGRTQEILHLEEFHQLEQGGEKLKHSPMQKEYLEQSLLNILELEDALPGGMRMGHPIPQAANDWC